MPYRMVCGLILVVLGCRELEVPTRPALLDEGQLAKAQMQAEVELRHSFGGRLRYHTELRTVAHADSLNILLATGSTPATAIEKLLLRYPTLFGCESSVQLELVDTVTERDGSRHVTLRQVQREVTVWGGSLTGHIDSEGRLRRIHAHTVPLMSWPAESSLPRYGAEEARQEALRLLAKELPQVSAAATTPKLYYLPAQRRLSLVYRIELSGQDGELPIRQAWFLSAQDLSVRAREELVAATDVPLSVSGRGVGVLGDLHELSIAQRSDSYSLEDLRRGSQRTTLAKPLERLPGRTVTSSRSDGWDSPHAVSVHAHLATLWDYFATTHQRFGWDGSGRGLVAVTHAEVRVPPLPVALFDGQRLLFGAGSPPQLLPSGAALDVVAHEYGHALTRSTSELAAEGESGAIDEGLANLWACLVERAMTPAQANWTVGESVYRPVQGTAALADLEDPTRTNQARLRSQQVTAQEGYSAGAALSLLERSLRRYNAGFVGHAGFLIAQQIGPEKTAAVLYRAVTTYLHRYADADDLADAMVASAQDLYGAKAESVTAVRSAWQAVGVTGFLR